MRLKMYRAATMAEAMAQLRDELGPDALILGARTLKDGVELTGARDTEGEPTAVARRRTDQPLSPPAARHRTPIWPVAAPAMPALAAYHGVPERLARGLEGSDLAQSIARLLRFAPIAPEEGPLLFAGPPGAGKTTTVARLATRLVLAGDRPMVISTDGRRAGATEQLAAYTRLLGLNLVVATHPTALMKALARRESAGPVLIDTAGSDVHDAVQMGELTELADTADARTVLVMPAGLDAHEAEDLAAAHAQCGAELLVVTRLDLARRLGSVVSAAGTRQMALAEAGIGAGAADGLVPFTADLLAARLQRMPTHRNAALLEVST